MIRDTAWREERRRDGTLDLYVELHEEAFKQIFNDWALSKLERFSGRYVFADLNAQYIFQQLQTSDVIPAYSYSDPEHILPLLEQATYRTDPDRRLYERHYLFFYEEYRKENEVTWECEEYLGWYIEKLAEEFTYHYLQLILCRKGHEPDTYLTAHPKPIDDRVSALVPHESTPEGKRVLRAVVRRVGRFNAHATGNK